MDGAKIITVLCTDMRNYMYHSRPYPREDEADYYRRVEALSDIVRDFHALTIACAHRHDTRKEAVALTTGDGLIIGFQDPQHAITAFQVALDLRIEYDDFFNKANRSMGEKRSSTALGFGMGLHTGHVMIRQFSSYHVPGAVDNIILGDALNIAARLQELTKDHPGCTIMLSEDTHDCLVRDLGPAALTSIVDYHLHFIRGYKPLRLYGLQSAVE